MTSSQQTQDERFAVVSQALQSGLPVPTDTFITEDMPLLLTRLSQIPAAPEPVADPGGMTPPRPIP